MCSAVWWQVCLTLWKNFSFSCKDFRAGWSSSWNETKRGWKKSVLSSNLTWFWDVSVRPNLVEESKFRRNDGIWYSTYSKTYIYDITILILTKYISYTSYIQTIHLVLTIRTLWSCAASSMGLNLWLKCSLESRHTQHTGCLSCRQ